MRINANTSRKPGDQGYRFAGASEGNPSSVSIWFRPENSTVKLGAGPKEESSASEGKLALTEWSRVGILFQS
jgi:hypothetical protein